MVICFICKQIVVDDKRSLGQKARCSLQKACEIRGDNAIFGEQIADKSIDIEVHRKCYLDYIDIRAAEAAVKRKSRELER